MNLSNVWIWAFIANMETMPKRFLSIDRTERGCTKLEERFGDVLLFHSLTPDISSVIVISSNVAVAEIGDWTFSVKGSSFIDTFQQLVKLIWNNINCRIDRMHWIKFGTDADTIYYMLEEAEERLHDCNSCVESCNMPVPGEVFGLLRLDSQMLERIVHFDVNSGVFEDIFLIKYSTSNYELLCNERIGGKVVYDSKTYQNVIAIRGSDCMQINEALDAVQQDTHSEDFHRWCEETDAQCAAIDANADIPNTDKDFKAWCNEQAYYYNQLESDKQRKQEYEFYWCNAAFFGSYYNGILQYSRGYWLVKYECETRWHYYADNVNRLEWPMMQTIYFETLEKALRHLKHHGAIIQPAD